MDCSTPGFPVHHQLPELAQTLVHWVGDAIQSSPPLSSPFSSCLQSFPASGSFPRSQFFTSGGQSIGTSVSISVLPVNTQDWNQCMCIIVSNSLRPHALWPTGILCPWESSSKNKGVGCYFLPQGIFPTQGSNLSLLCLLHCRQILYHLSHWGSFGVWGLVWCGAGGKSCSLLICFSSAFTYPRIKGSNCFNLR